MAATAPEQPAPMAPRPFRVTRRRRETNDTWTLELEPVSGAPLSVAPGQFTMLYAFGVGEVPISVSGQADGVLVHTVRAVGAVTEAICAAKPGTVLGVRGPLGNAWPLGEGGDVVVIAGGIGLAPLRGVVYELVRRRGDFGEAALLYGSRTPAELLYPKELERWRRRSRSTSPSTRPTRAGRARSASSPSSSARLASTRPSRRRLSAARRS